MTAYEFVYDYKGDFTKVNKSYDARVLRHDIIYSNNGNDFDMCKDYREARELFIDITMSCTVREAIEWCKYLMVKAVAYGVDTKNLDWRTKYLAAYDLFMELTQGKIGCGTTEFLTFNPLT